MESLVLKHVRTLCSYLVDEDKANVGDWSSARDVSDWIAYVASDIMGDMTFNRNWNVMESEEHRGVLEILAEGVAGLNLVGRVPPLHHVQSSELI